MADQLRVTVEVGPKGKRVAAVAPDWPGLERGARTEDEAVTALHRYLSRYAKVATLAGLASQYAPHADLRVVERYQGIGSTDFWGISFAFSSIDRQAMSTSELARELTLLRACWKYFDDVRRRVSSEMKAGPRGGGRDRDRIVRHVLGVEQDWARKVGVLGPKDVVIVDQVGLRRFRDDYCAAITSYHREGKIARTWPLRFLIRHSAFHTMDHAWEMEDKDLTARAKRPS